jgi:putative serine protease PepD
MGPGESRDDEPLDDDGEGADDEHAPSRGAPPDPLDRVWVHPTELPASATVASPPPSESSARSESRLRWVSPVVAGVVSAVVTVVVLAIAGAFDRSTTSPNSGSAGNSGSFTNAVGAAARVGASVVAVSVRDAQGSRRGSGLSVRHGRQVVTTARLVGEAIEVDIVTNEGGRHRARVVARDRASDLALLSINDDIKLPAARLSEQIPATGSPVWILGAPPPGTSAPWMSGGMMSSVDALVVAPGNAGAAGAGAAGPSIGGLLETDASSGAKAAGGALIDSGGTVSGLVLGQVDGDDATYAVPIGTVIAIAEALQTRGTVLHGSLGVDAGDSFIGPVVTNVNAKTAAANAGIRVGDRIEAVNGRAVDSAAALLAVVRRWTPGTTVLVELWRGDQRQKVEVQLDGADG